MILTKAGSILGPIATVLGYVMDILFRFTGTFGVLNVGLCIILFTIVMKMLMIPLTIKQQKTTKLMSIMNPEIQAIQKKYKGKTDNESMQRQNIEIQAVYEKYGTSMTGGCLPLLIQMPILFALYRVIYNIPAYVPSVRVYFDNVVNPLMGQPEYIEKLKGITNITTAAAVKSLDNFDFTSANKLVDLLYKFSTSQWQELEGAFPAISSVIAENESIIERIEDLQEKRTSLTKVWMQLTDAEQELLYRKYVLDQTTEELSGIFQCSRDSIRMRLSRARRKSLRLMKGEGTNDETRTTAGKL